MMTPNEALSQCLDDLGNMYGMSIHLIVKEKMQAIFSTHQEQLVKRLEALQNVTDTSLDEWLNAMTTRKPTLDNLSQDEAYILYCMASAAWPPRAA